VPIIAVVGRPNVGKSMLFNKIAGKRLSIVEDTPGVTRDRLFAEVDWDRRTFSLIDTGGIEPDFLKSTIDADADVLRFMRLQAELAIESADVVILVTDLRTGPTAADADVAALLQKSGKPVVLAVNKADTPGHPPAELYDFYSLGLGDPLAVSALHGLGIGELLDACMLHLPPDESEQEDGESRIAVAVIGKPNVGKSSLVNRILGFERVIVSDVPGTTRDAVDTPFENEYGRFTLIDTAGMRKKSKIGSAIEHYSTVRSVLAAERANVCLIMIDATQGVTEQDARVAGLAHDGGKASVIVVNKWDAIEKDEKAAKKMEAHIREKLAYMPYAPIITVSALTGQRVSKLFPLVVDADAQCARRVTTGSLNNLLADAVARVQPPTDKGKRLKVYYMTQTGTRPPHFVAFCNDSTLFHFSYRRYLENRIRETYGFAGTPIRITVRERGESGESI
jgi:GTP-binding protein